LDKRKKERKKERKKKNERKRERKEKKRKRKKKKKSKLSNGVPALEDPLLHGVRDVLSAGLDEEAARLGPDQLAALRHIELRVRKRLRK
jgi:hypothetical protein